jgi:ABC-2 type transport system permease protein
VISVQHDVSAPGTGHPALRTPEGRIYDLGYQPYTGPRQGTGRALYALFRYSLRRAWALGRPFRSKVIPWGLAVLAMIPALIGLGVAALFARFARPDDEGFQLFSYQGYYGTIATLILLFCTAIAPELVCPDQRQRVVTLYFSRSIGRFGYVGAKLGAMLAALLAFCIVPQVVLFMGNAMASRDTWGYIQDHLGTLPRILAAALLISLYFGSTSLAVASFTTRRIYAAATFFALMVLSNAVAGALHAALNNEASRRIALFAFFDVPIAATYWIFDRDNGGTIAAVVKLPQAVWFLAAVGYTAVALFALLWRYVRLQP